MIFLMRVICSVLFSLNMISLISSEENESQILQSIFLQNPYLDTAPNLNNESVVVTINTFIEGIQKFDEKNMEIDIHLIFRMSWLDPRLSFHKDNTSEEKQLSYILLKELKNIWIPDIFFRNEIHSYDHNLFQSGQYLRLYSDGKLYCSKRMWLTLSCPMNLKYFPFDDQICPIDIATYGSTAEHIKLKWDYDNPVQMTESLNLPNALVQILKASNTIFKTRTGEYSGLKVDILFKRIFHSYFKRYYVPIIITVLLSWIPFCLKRVLILRTYISFSAVIFYGWFNVVIHSDLPSTSYNTGIDYWNAANFIFVLLAALETVLISYMIKTNTTKIKRTNPNDNEEYKMLPCLANEKKNKLEIIDEKTDIDAEIMKIKTNFKICFINVNKEVEIIDSASKLLFPSAYILYLFFYWIRY